MTLNIDLEDVPDAILEAVKARIMANRRRLLDQQQQQQPAALQPKPQFRKFGADSRTWKRPQPAAVASGGKPFVYYEPNNNITVLNDDPGYYDIRAQVTAFPSGETFDTAFETQSAPLLGMGGSNFVISGSGGPFDGPRLVSSDSSIRCNFTAGSWPDDEIAYNIPGRFSGLTYEIDLKGARPADVILAISLYTKDPYSHPFTLRCNLFSSSLVPSGYDGPPLFNNTAPLYDLEVFNYSASQDYFHKSTQVPVLQANTWNRLALVLTPTVFKTYLNRSLVASYSFPVGAFPIDQFNNGCYPEVEFIVAAPDWKPPSTIESYEQTTHTTIELGGFKLSNAPYQFSSSRLRLP